MRVCGQCRAEEKALGVLALAIPLVRAGKRLFLRQIAEQLVEPYSQGLASMSPTTATCSPSRAKAALWKALRSEGVTLVSLPWAVSNTDACRRFRAARPARRSHEVRAHWQ